MKKLLFALSIFSLLLAGCTKDNSGNSSSGGNNSNTPGGEELTSDKDLVGQVVNLEGFENLPEKIFVLNEGQMSKNNSTLDMLRTNDGNYINSVFKKMNPEVGAGLGDVGNDILVCGDEIWLVINNSGLVDVLSAENEKEIAAIAIPTPRSIAVDDKYAYVSSWAGAHFAGGTSTALTLKGRVYRIDLATKKLIDNVEVGYQPEGLAIRSGKLYVANSGGINGGLESMNYTYDNTVSVIDLETFTVTKTITVGTNPQSVYYDGSSYIYISSFGDYYTVHSALHAIDGEDNVTKVSDYASITAQCGNRVYCLGNNNELDWNAAADFTAWYASDGSKGGSLELNLGSVYPYHWYFLSQDTILISDALDYTLPGKVHCFHNGELIWSITAGVCPGHFAVK